MRSLDQSSRVPRPTVSIRFSLSYWFLSYHSDYAQLGKLKSHFPSIPVIAVTATASDRVRKDVCEILRVGSNYNFFRSTANRPNLVYSVKAKPDRKDAIIAEMAEFIKEKYAHGAGIVYTYSRKDADTVANSLCDYGVIAEVSLHYRKIAGPNKSFKRSNVVVRCSVTRRLITVMSP